jgi:hypothetical protein
VCGHAQIASDIGARLAADDGVQARRQFAFGFIRKQFVEPGRDREAEHAITQEFEPLIARPTLAAVCQCTPEQGDVARRVANRLTDPGGKGMVGGHRRSP